MTVRLLLRARRPSSGDTLRFQKLVWTPFFLSPWKLLVGLVRQPYSYFVQPVVVWQRQTVALMGSWATF